MHYDDNANFVPTKGIKMNNLTAPSGVKLEKTDLSKLRAIAATENVGLKHLEISISEIFISLFRQGTDNGVSETSLLFVVTSLE